MSACLRGLTLIETVVVLAVIAILAAIAIPALAHYQRTAARAEVAINLDGIETALVALYTENPTAVLFAENGAPLYYPDRTLYDWTPDTDFDLIGFHPDGQVRGVYRIRTGQPVSGPVCRCLNPVYELAGMIGLCTAKSWCTSGEVDVDGDGGTYGLCANMSQTSASFSEYVPVAGCLEHY